MGVLKLNVAEIQTFDIWGLSLFDEQLYASEYCNGLQNSVSGYSGVNIVKEKRKLQI